MSQSNKKVAVIGTVGVPAKYGGFETLVENILADNCSPDVEYTVYCSSSAYPNKRKEYKGAKLKYIPLKANGAQSVLYDIISIFRALFSKNKVLLILGVSGAIILPLVRVLSRKRLVINIDGLEHRRKKWGPKVRKFLKFSEKIAVRNAHVIIADNKAIQDYVRNEYGLEAELVAYGGDHVICDTSAIENDVLDKYNLEKNKFAFSLCRIEPENNVHLTLEAFKDTPSEKLVFVGNWSNSEYGRNLVDKFGPESNILLLDPIYDIKILNVLRSKAKVYIHGHSAGGTNPSLVEAMFFEASILTFGVSYNRETTENQAWYYDNVQELRLLLKNHASNSKAMNEIANRRYIWSVIAKEYEQLY